MRVPVEDAEHRLIRERAAEWVCELQEAGPERRAAFAAWVRQSPRHIEEFLLAATAWKALDEIGPKQPEQVEQALASALMHAAHDPVNVVSFTDTGTAPPFSGRVPLRSSTAWKTAAGIAAVSVTGAFGWWSVSSFVLVPTYSTAVGEQRTVRLTDGSVVYLNTSSRLRTDFSLKARNVTLVEGEAMFAVARDATRPFRVDTGTAVIEAVGTEFNVKRRSKDVRVAVLEGRVRIDNRMTSWTNESSVPLPPATGNDTGIQLLNAGEEATIAGTGKIVRKSSGEVKDAVAWRERRLVFRGETLDEIVTEVNRYNTQRRFRIEGDSARNRRFAGTFSADEPQALVRFLRQYEDLSLDTTSEEIVIYDR